MSRAVAGLARRLGVFHLLRRAKLAMYSHLPPRLRDDRHAIEFYSMFIRPKDLVFDIGANVGIKTKTFLGLGAAVICLEPLPAALAELQAAFRSNSKVKVVPKAVSDEEGQAELYGCEEESGLSTMSSRWKDEGRFSADHAWTGSFTVPTTTLDLLIAEFGCPRYCKIDVEGYEHVVLKGLSQPIEHISFEYHGELLEEARQCLESLTKLGSYRFNCTVDGEMKLHFETFVGAEDLLSFIHSNLRLDQDDVIEGEIFCSLVRPPQPADGSQSTPSQQEKDILTLP